MAGIFIDILCWVIVSLNLMLSPLPLTDTYLPFRCKLVSAGPHPFTCPLNENAVIEGYTAQNHETKQAIKRTSPAVTSLGTTWLIFVRPASYQSYYLYRALLEGRANPESPSPRRTRFVNQILMQILVFVSFFLFAVWESAFCFVFLSEGDPSSLAPRERKLWQLLPSCWRSFRQRSVINSHGLH